MKKILVLSLFLSGCGWLPPLYGHTSTTPALQGDVVKLIKEDLKAKYSCDTLGLVDSEVKQKSDTLVVEEWTVNACRNTYTYDVVLTPNVWIPAPKDSGMKPTRGTAIQLVDRTPNGQHLMRPAQPTCRKQASMCHRQ